MILLIKLQNGFGVERGLRVNYLRCFNCKIEYIYLLICSKSEATVRDFRTVRKECKREVTRNIEPYNPGARHCATQRLKDYLET